jgi:hypothetical protein
LPNSVTIVDQFMPEARPVTARLVAVALALLVVVPMLVTVLDITLFLFPFFPPRHDSHH